MVSFEFGDASFSESEGIVFVRVALSLVNSTLGNPLTFDVAVTNGTAVEGKEQLM